MKLLVLVTILSATGLAQKSVFIQNDSGYAAVVDSALPEIKKHFTVADSKEKADLVFVFTRHLEGSHTHGSIDADGDYSERTSATSIIELDVLNPKGEKVWTNSRPWTAPYPNLNAIALFHKVKPPSKKLVDDYLAVR